jgi:hypothetical protein
MGTPVRAIGVLIALALVLTSAQCVMACAVAACHTQNNVPPCHQQQRGHTHKLPLTCSHELAIARTAHLNPQVSDCDFANAVFTMTAVASAPNVAAASGVAGQNSSPPGLTCLSRLVLRI